MLTHRGTAQQRGSPDTCAWRLSAFPRPAARSRGTIAGPWPRPQWTTLANSHTLAPVQASPTRQHEQARSFLRQARAAGAEEAVSALPPEIHAAHGLHEPDMSLVPENRENRLRRLSSERTPTSTALDAERTERGALLRVKCRTCACRADDTHPARPRGAD